MTTIIINENITAVLTEETAAPIKAEFEFLAQMRADRAKVNKTAADVWAMTTEERDEYYRQCWELLNKYDYTDYYEPFESAWRLVGGIREAIWHEEHDDELRAYLDKIEAKLAKCTNALDWLVVLNASNYSDIHKDLYGYRPHNLRCPFDESGISWAMVDAEIERRYPM